MSDLLTTVQRVPSTTDVARRVADLVLEHCSTGDDTDATVGFLRAWADRGDAAAATGNGSGRATTLEPAIHRLGLARDEIDLVMLAGLADEHEGLAATFRALHPLGEPRPTAGLAALLLGGGPDDRARLRTLLTSAAVSRQGLLRLSEQGSFFERSMLLAEGLWEALHGYDAWPTDLPRVPLGPPPPGLEGWLGQPDVVPSVEMVRADGRATILIVHEDRSVCLARAAALAAAAGRPAVAASVGTADRARLEQLGIHAAVRGAVPVVVAVTAPEEPVVEPTLPDLPGVFIVCAAPGTVRAAPDRALLLPPVRAVASLDQQAAWSRAVPRLAARALELATRHPLDPALTAQLASDLSAVGGEVDLAGVSRLVRARAASSLPTGATLDDPAVPWDHVVLPAESGLQLRDAVARVAHQDTVLEAWGLRRRANAVPGARLLLTGPPGTGKSLAAAAVATALATSLLVIDVSRIVSKWLGETEKNLAAVFDAAERTQAVLLLDEADALFGTRTEISDAHDRYANLETAYLLQRLERFEGVVILTTNLRANIDVAFIRRMDFVIDFPLPDQRGRADIWAGHLPHDRLADDVDIDVLSRLYAVPGAWIRNAVINAAYTAASGDSPVHMDHLVAAMRREFAKAGLPFPGEPLRRQP